MPLKLVSGTIFNMFNARLLIQKDLDCFVFFFMIGKGWKDGPELPRLSLTERELARLSLTERGINLQT